MEVCCLQLAKLTRFGRDRLKFGDFHGLFLEINDFLLGSLGSNLIIRFFVFLSVRLQALRVLMYLYLLLSLLFICVHELGLEI